MYNFRMPSVRELPTRLLLGPGPSPVPTRVLEAMAHPTIGHLDPAFLALMDDTYPSTDEEQSVRLDFPYPDVREGLNRWAPLFKWFLAIPHFLVLVFLTLAAFVCVVIAWFAILFTGRYPRGLFDFVEGVIRWWNRVIGYALVLVTDEYPPFSLSA